MWKHDNALPVTGDEPHYLVIASGLLPHFEIEQTGPYTREFRNRTISASGIANSDAVPGPSNTHAEWGPRGLFNVHNLGLPILLAVPYLIAGEIGARLMMIAFGALIVLLLSRLVSLTTLKKKTQFAITFPLAIGLPLVTSATQIYPDLPAGAICLAAIYLLMREAKSNKQRDGLFTVCALAYLPWLHIRFTLPMVVLLVAVAYSKREIGLRALLIRYATPALVSLAALALYNVYAFGNASGPYSSGDVMVNRIALLQFLGLFFDQNQGLLLQQPLHFVGLYYGFRNGIKRPIAVLAITFVALSVLIPNATLKNLYGGWSFSGRLGWAAACAMLPLTILGLEELYQRRKRLSVTVISIGIAIQVRHFVAVLIQKRSLYQHDFNSWIGTYSIFWSPFEKMLPQWRDASWAFSYTPNIVFLLLSIVLFGLGLKQKLLSIKRANVAAALIFLSVLILGLSARLSNYSYPPQRWMASDLPTQIGVTMNESRIATQTEGKGFLTFGPYWAVPSGEYEVRILYSSVDLLPVNGILDVYMSDREMSLKQIGLETTNGQSLEKYVRVKVTNAMTGKMEIRTSYSGSGILKVDWIQLRRLNENSEN